MATALAREVDFFSIGANDLFQYTMAVDRTNSRVTGMFGLLEPAVWRLIALVVQAGVAHDGRQFLQQCSQAMRLRAIF